MNKYKEMQRREMYIHMKRIMLRVAYDGTAYCGWQKQPHVVTIEGELNKAIGELTGEDIEVIGASRTDSGVHSMGNVAVFDTQSRIPPEKFVFALNTRLPDDIRVQESCEVKGDFHPRHCNCRKTYEYRILNRKMNIPVKRLYTHYVYVPLDIKKMQEGAAFIEGEHDFAAFCSAGSQVKDTVRMVYKLDVVKEGEEIIIRINGNGFLYNMVRIVAGTLIKVGMGEIAPEDIKGIIESKDRSNAGQTAPAKGLSLMEITYENEDFINEK